GFVAVMFLVVRPVLSWWKRRRESVFSNPVPIAFALAMASAWVTAELGLHSVFGGFLAGLTMRASCRTPDSDVVRSMEQAGNLLLPLFFVVTGLSLNIGALHGSAVALLALVVPVAIVGKVVPAYGASRLCGLRP